MPSMFDRLSEKFADALRHLQNKAKISPSNIEDALSEVRTALLEADVNFKVVKEFIATVKQKALGEKVLKGVNPRQQFIKIVQDRLSEIMGQTHKGLNFTTSHPLPILIVGLNGQGKTTFSGKLAHHLTQKQKKSVLLVPADTFRPAAKEQLITLAKKIEVDYFDSDLSMHPKDIALAAMDEAQRQHKDTLIIDTAGRLHADEELMKQIKEVKAVLAKFAPETLIVADAMTGQEAVNMALGFHQAVQLTGAVLSKMDSDARGGVALSIRHVTGVPIKYLSVGEKMEELELFHPDRLAGRILGKGDVVSLVEKAEEEINQAEAENMLEKFQQGKFSVDSLMKQMDMMSKLGGLTSILKMMPNMGGFTNKLKNLNTGSAKNDMKQIRVVIDSMNKKERENYKIIKEPQIKRIAKGSGNSEQKVRELLYKFRQMEEMMGKMGQFMKLTGNQAKALGRMGIDTDGIESLEKMKKNKKSKGKGPWGKSFFG